MADYGNGILGCEGVDVRVDFLDVEEDAGERGGEVEGCVGGVVGLVDEGVGVGGGGEGWGEEGFGVEVGGCHGSLGWWVVG